MVDPGSILTERQLELQQTMKLNHKEHQGIFI
jgi:hypothetical protein